MKQNICGWRPIDEKRKKLCTSKTCHYSLFRFKSLVVCSLLVLEGRAHIISIYTILALYKRVHNKFNNFCKLLINFTLWCAGRINSARASAHLGEYWLHCVNSYVRLRSFTRRTQTHLVQSHSTVCTRSFACVRAPLIKTQNAFKAVQFPTCKRTLGSETFRTQGSIQKYLIERSRARDPGGGRSLLCMKSH